MKTKNNGTTAAKVNNSNESKNRVNNVAMPAGEYGDLCYDYFGKSSVIVFGNTDDHAAQLEAIGGKYSERLKYSPLQNGRKWTEKQGRTAGYYFTTEQGKREAVQYVQRVNHAIFDRYEQSTAGMEGVIQRPADFKEGDRVRTIHGLGTVTANEPQYNKAVSVCVRLDKMTYNYAWKGMPHTFIECRCDEITRYTPSAKLRNSESKESDAFNLPSRDEIRPLAKSETADERKAADIARERQEKPGTVNTSWATDFTPDDFEKLTSRYEIADEDRDIMGRRFHTGEGLWTVDVFVSDYAGNEAHALIYLLTGEGEVRANVLSLDHLRQTLTEAKGWTRTA